MQSKATHAMWTRPQFASSSVAGGGAGATFAFPSDAVKERARKALAQTKVCMSVALGWACRSVIA